MPEHANDQGPGEGGGGDHSERRMRPEYEAAFARRVADLGDRLGRAARRRGLLSGEERDGGGHGVKRETTADSAARIGRGMAYGMRLASELVAAVVVGGLLGVGLDRWLGTWPWLFLVLFLLGFAAGVLNVVRATSALTRDVAGTPRRDGGDGNDR